MTKRNDFTCAADEIAHVLDDLEVQSKSKGVLFFKHSARCPISCAALDQFQADWDKASSKGLFHDARYFLIDVLDVKGARLISNALADRYGITHASP